MASYKNPWHNPHDSKYGPESYETGAAPIEYRDYLIYERIPGHCWDVVKDGHCITQRAGLDGAKRAIDERHEKAQAYANRQSDKVDRMLARADRKESEANARCKWNDTMIGAMAGTPILIGHHSEKRHRRDLAKIDNNYRKAHELDTQAKRLRSRAASAGTHGIQSDDPDAVIKLRQELRAMQDKRDRMKAINAAYRKAKKPTTPEDPAWAKFAELAELNPDCAEFASIKRHLCDNGYSWEAQPYPGYELQNLGANIKRLERRVTELVIIERIDALDESGDGWQVYEDRDAGRVCCEVSERLDRREWFAGWNWSRSNQRWQRKNTANGILDARRVAARLRARYESEVTK